MIDSYKHKGLRRKMLEALLQSGIRDERVLNALYEVPRHLFIDSALAQHAYELKAFPIGCAQTISSPLTVARQSSLLQTEAGDKVLEIGTGSGYQTAVLAALDCGVYSIERQHKLFIKAKRLLEKLRINTKYLTYGDGFEGLPSFAPFDEILVTAGAETIPEKLLLQLKIGGTMVVPLGAQDQKMWILKREGENDFSKRQLDADYRFVPMLKRKV